jgi:twitching motility protein PilJ
MAITTDNASTFKTVSAVIALCLIVAALLTYLQAGGGGSSTAEIAALSQAIPGQAQHALEGNAAAFEQLDTSIRKISSLRDGAPGRQSDWQQLESGAAAILAKRGEVEAFRRAANQMGVDASTILESSNELLDRSGSTAIVQEFQQRVDRIRETAAMGSSSSDSAASSIADDVVFLRDVANALAGEQSGLDIRPLSNEDREAALLPISGNLANLEQQSARFTANFSEIRDLSTTQASMAASADALLDSAFGSSANDSLAFALVGGLLALHSKTSVFEKAAKEQAAQNDRNQQAILRLLDEMGSLADGDLTVEATVTEDITGTIADSFNFAIEELRKLVATVNDTALMVDAATKQTENTAAHLAKAADNQAKEINAATESIVSMAASIEEVSGNAERSSDVARHSVEVAHKGGEAVRRTIDGMNAIRETIQETSKRIKRLGESSQEIGNIVELINDIAEQTNILALNASIQASMAGEAGRGFAVVADEVQRLAERSTNATKQIEVLVRTIQSDTNEAVVSMERSTTDVVGGALLAENAGAALDEIEQVSNQIASLVQNISSSARQQAGSAADVTRRTTRLREIGDQTGQATTATAASISKLSELATQLRKTVEGFALPADMMQASVLARTTSSLAPPPAAPVNPRAKTG